MHLKYPQIDGFNNHQYHVNSPLGQASNISAFIPPRNPRPQIMDFQDISFEQTLQIHRITLQNDDFSTLAQNEGGKLISVNKFPDDIFLTGFCLWFDNNLKLRGKNKDLLTTYFNKIRKEANSFKWANELTQRVCKIPFDEKFLKVLGNFWEYNISEDNFHQSFYENLSKSNSEYMQIVYSSYMRICCYYVLQKIKDCFLLKDKLIIQDCLKNYDNYVQYLNDFQSKSFSNNEYKMILNLLSESIGIRIKLITINKQLRILMKESFPTNMDKSFELYRDIIKLKVLIINDNDVPAIYRAYRNPSLPEKMNKVCLECKGNLNKKIKSNVKNVCFDCFKSLYCSLRRERLTKDNYFESACKHKYCKSCLIDLYNSNQSKSNLDCCVTDCKKPINFIQIESFFRGKMGSGNNQELEEFRCPGCSKTSIISRNSKSSVVFCCKVCNKTSCIQHKTLIEKCDCYCPICKSKYNSAFQQVGENAHIELLECLKCKIITCKTCKFQLKNYEDYCNCKCYLCFDLKLIEKGYRCKGCKFMCNLCLLSLKRDQINFCKKCTKATCRVCTNEIANEKSQYFLRSEYCIYCEISKKT